MTWEPPRCRHGAIILGCLEEDCPEQKAWLAVQMQAEEEYHQRLQAAAAKLVRRFLDGQT